LAGSSAPRRAEVSGRLSPDQGSTTRPGSPSATAARTAR
jgi:hypothetical protein